MKIDTDLIAVLILIVFAAIIIAVSIFFAKWIATSDMPLWLKYWLLSA